MTLIFRVGENEYQGNWCPITLLNVCYMIYHLFKNSLVQTSTHIMKVIDYDQIAFILLWFIFKINMLIQEMIDWAKQTSQPFVFLKLDFAQACDKMSWEFLFNAMVKTGLL
jgi:hypothetical protein